MQHPAARRMEGAAANPRTRLPDATSQPPWHGPPVQVHRGGGKDQGEEGKHHDVDRHREVVCARERVSHQVREVGERRADGKVQPPCGHLLQGNEDPGDEDERELQERGEHHDVRRHVRRGDGKEHPDSREADRRKEDGRTEHDAVQEHKPEPKPDEERDRRDPDAEEDGGDHVPKDDRLDGDGAGCEALEGLCLPFPGKDCRRYGGRGEEEGHPHKPGEEERERELPASHEEGQEEEDRHEDTEDEHGAFGVIDPDILLCYRPCPPHLFGRSCRVHLLSSSPVSRRKTSSSDGASVFKVRIAIPSCRLNDTRERMAVS